ncbi:MAG: hypothetical protein CL758_02940 [Chloroflexi bacterium]|nr:hypothetical protein [Chloroflexota bacterium]|tara:strand:+ start:198 stop:875 length:678 start_codon:yes stop_codon:yes gene_type:complete
MIVLHGGNEFTPGCEKIDSTILSLFGISSSIVILPTAAAKQNPLKAANNGINYFKKLGFNAEKLMILNNNDANNFTVVNYLDNFNIIYFTGGDPDYLLKVLTNSLLIQKIKDKLINQECILIGSSAGAMVFGVKMLRKRLVNTLGILNGLIVPHYESNKLILDNFKIIEKFQNLTPVLGIDSKTSCFYNCGVLRVIGEGKVTLFYDDNKQILFNDQVVELAKLTK